MRLSDSGKWKVAGGAVLGPNDLKFVKKRHGLIIFELLSHGFANWEYGFVILDL